MKKIPAVIQILLSYQWQCTLTWETQTEHAISHSQGDDEDENKNNWDLLWMFFKDVNVINRCTCDDVRAKFH